MLRAQGFAQQGDRTVWTAGVASTTVVQESAPFATITVYLTGTTTLATIYSDNQMPPTPMGNPFTANADGYWFFYAVNGRYDVMIQAEDWAWTMGDVFLGDPTSWSADENANGHWLRGLGGIGLDNGVCQANIFFGPNCTIEITGNSGQLLALLDQQGDLQLTGALSAPCVQYSLAGAPSMSMCLDASGTLQISDGSGTNIGSLDQGGLLDLYKLVAQQIEATTSIFSLGTLGSQDGIETFGTIVAPKVQAPTVQANCVQLVLGGPTVYGPSIWLCADSDGTLQIKNDGGTVLATMTQAGLLTVNTLVATQIEGTQSVWSLGLFGATQGGTATFQATDPSGQPHWYTFENGVLTATAPV